MSIKERLSGWIMTTISIVTLNKLLTLQILSFVCDVAVFYLVFSMTGGFAATIAALLASFIFPYLIRKKFK